VRVPARDELDEDTQREQSNPRGGDDQRGGPPSNDRSVPRRTR
jgi:hypothetical protein